MRLAVLTDIHHRSDTAPVRSWHGVLDYERALERVREALDVLVVERPDALALLGDLTDCGDGPSLESVLSVCDEGFDGPIWVVPGNHDQLERDDALDAVVGRRAWAHIRRGQMSQADPTVVLSHYPLLSRADRLAEAGLKYAGDLPDLSTFAAELVARPGATIVLSGHLHVRDSNAERAVLQLSCGPVIERPHELSLIEIDVGVDAISVERRCVPLLAAEDETAAALVAAEERWEYSDAAWHRVAMGAAYPPRVSANRLVRNEVTRRQLQHERS